MAAMRRSETATRLLWFVALWAAGVVATAAFAYAIRLIFQL